MNNLGISGRLTRTFIRSPLTPLLLIASIVVGTLYAYLNYQSTVRRLIFVAASVVVPVLAVYSFFGVALIDRWCVLRRAKRMVPRCRKCRYILRGLATRRCPECGAQIT